MRRKMVRSAVPEVRKMTRLYQILKYKFTIATGQIFRGQLLLPLRRNLFTFSSRGSGFQINLPLHFNIRERSFVSPRDTISYTVTHSDIA